MSTWFGISAEFTIKPDVDQADLAAALAAASPADRDATAEAAANGVVTLNRNYRFGQGGIADLAAAIRRNDPDQVLTVLRAGHTDVEFLDTDTGAAQKATRAVRADVVTQTENVVSAAAAGDAAAARAHRDSFAGKDGVSRGAARQRHDKR